MKLTIYVSRGDLNHTLVRTRVHTRRELGVSCDIKTLWHHWCSKVYKYRGNLFFCTQIGKTLLKPQLCVIPQVGLYCKLNFQLSDTYVNVTKLRYRIYIIVHYYSHSSGWEVQHIQLYHLYRLCHSLLDITMPFAQTSAVHIATIQHNTTRHM